jgi:hypothetical protein
MGQSAYAAWRHQSFPTGSADDSVDELHANLILADTWVAEAAIPFFESGVYRPAAVDVIGEIRKLDDLARELRSGLAEEHQRQVDEYRHYAGLLIAVYEEFLAGAAHRA